MDSEDKICRICVAAVGCKSLDEIVKGISLEEMLSEIFNRLKIEDYGSPITVCCEICRDELLATFEFIQKIEQAHFKLGSIDSKEQIVHHSDPLDVDSVTIKSELAEEKPIANIEIVEVKPSLDSEGFSDSDHSVWEPEDDDTELEKLERKRKRLRESNWKKKDPKRCCGCKEPLTCATQVEEHTERYHVRHRITDVREMKARPIECEVCFQRFVCLRDLTKHQRKMFAKELHPCKRCPEEFANDFQLSKHMQQFHKREKICDQADQLRQQIPKCCVCMKQFEKKESMLEHIEKEHPLDENQLHSTSQFKCETCKRRFMTEKGLLFHQRRPFIKHRYQCSQCGKTYRSKSVFQDHERSHANIRQYECPICQMRFALKNCFKTHVKLHATPKDQFKCEFCGKGFRQLCALREHQIIHTQTEDRPFKCTLCPITFKRQEALDHHMKEHLGEKQFKCNQCPMTYIYQRDLRRHIRLKHEGVKPYVCEVCSMAFTHKARCLNHMKTHESAE
ncbi:zinc finger protein 501-like [Uranotaenia lowii]|uniref:zinc finger protein 501-like n=1 Tax=Uranotaenia lowii TaxID=190385 RepID=UPI002479F449|nr:zinc finger protein 501-like [Uranotaenia lowii]